MCMFRFSIVVNNEQVEFPSALYLSKVEMERRFVALEQENTLQRADIAELKSQLNHALISIQRINEILQINDALSMIDRIGTIRVSFNAMLDNQIEQIRQSMNNIQN